MLLNAVMCVWNEEDIIESAVKHAFAQGCANVFIVNNDSSDKTVDIAIRAGAQVAAAFKTPYFDEDKKVAHLNAVVDYINSITQDERIWWLYLDDDEFPNFDNNLTILEMLKSIDSSIKAIHGFMYDHRPTHYPYHILGYHPIDCMPLCTVSKVGKVPLLRYDKGMPHLWSISGAHDFITHGHSIQVMKDAIHVHHFPYRDIATTLARSRRIIHKTDDGVSRADWYNNFLKQVHKSDSYPSYHLSKHNVLKKVYSTISRDSILKAHSLQYNYSCVTRWYNLGVEKDFQASAYDKAIHLAVYHYFLRQYDIALCRFKDALDVCDDSYIRLLLLTKIAECFAESDGDTAYTIIEDVIGHNNAEINEYIHNTLQYIVSKTKKFVATQRDGIYKIDINNAIFPQGVRERYKAITDRVKFLINSCKG